MADAMSPADMSAVLGNRWGYPYGAGGFGFGGDSMMGILFLVLLLGGGFSGGWGNRGAFGTEAIQNQMQQGFDNQNNMANQREILAATNQLKILQKQIVLCQKPVIMTVCVAHLKIRNIKNKRLGCLAS